MKLLVAIMYVLFIHLPFIVKSISISISIYQATIYIYLASKNDPQGVVSRI